MLDELQKKYDSLKKFSDEASAEYAKIQSENDRLETEKNMALETIKDLEVNFRELLCRVMVKKINFCFSKVELRIKIQN